MGNPSKRRPPAYGKRQGHRPDGDGLAPKTIKKDAPKETPREYSRFGGSRLPCRADSAVAGNDTDSAATQRHLRQREQLRICRPANDRQQQPRPTRRTGNNAIGSSGSPAVWLQHRMQLLQRSAPPFVVLAHPCQPRLRLRGPIIVLLPGACSAGLWLRQQPHTAGTASAFAQRLLDVQHL
jgi:hypothetical protein